MLHFGDAPQATLLEKLNLTQQKHTFTNQKKCTTIQNKHTQKKLKPGLVASYDIHPANSHFDRTATCDRQTDTGP